MRKFLSGLLVACTTLVLATAAHADPPTSGPYVVGATVEAQYFGKFQRGVIVSIRVLPASGQKKYKVKWEQGGGEYEVTEAQMRWPAIVNFSGKDFKVGEFVHVWYSNAWLETQILDVKDGKIKVMYGGYGERWFAFDDRTIRNKPREEAEAKAAEREKAFIAEVVNPYYHYAVAIMWATGDKRLATNTVARVPWTGARGPKLVKEVPQMAQGLQNLAKLMQDKYGDYADIDVANHPQLKLLNEENKDLKYGASFYREAVKRTKDGLPKFLATRVRSTLDDQLKKLGALGEVSEHAAGGKGVWVAESKADPAVPGYDAFEPGTKDVAMEDGKAWKAALQNYLEPIYKAAGLGDAELAPLYAEADKAMADAKAAFQKNLPVMVVNFPSKDPVVEAFAKSFIVKNVPGANVMKAGTTSADWKVWTNAAGIPESRTRWGGALYKDPVTGLCAYGAVQAGQDYAGGGKYSKDTYFSGMGGAMFAYYVGKCK